MFVSIIFKGLPTIGLLMEWYHSMIIIPWSKSNDNVDIQGGVFIHEIHAGGAAEKSGALHHGDLVTKVPPSLLWC